MGFLIVVGCAVLGIAIGGAVGNDSTAGLGFFAGIAIGIVLSWVRSLSARIEGLAKELADLKTARAAAAPAPTRSEAAARAPTLAPTEPVLAPAPTPPPVPAVPATPRAPVPMPAPASERAVPPPRPAAAPPRAESGAPSRIKRWFTEGNVPVKIGILVLFAGVAALLKYASDQGWLTLPIELRLAGIALAAMAGLAFGWRERARRRTFALSLQGGAIGVLLMTVFAAFRLYALVSPGAAFALMLILVAGAGVLAVAQDSLALAVLGTIAGFAAPILISTGGGSHVVLFSYYALLNLAIVAIAWHKAWRALNLVGFAFTYVIGIAWGVLRYEPSLYGSTEPFLLAFFAIYLAIPILFARRRDPSRRDVVDGTLVFGNPLIAFGLQAVLLDGERMPLALSALGLAVVYAALAGFLIRSERLRVLGESFAVLAAGFATLAVPLAFSARTTASTFALEGAALVWLGFRQRQLLPRIAGLLLQLVAVGAFVAALAFDAGRHDTIAILNGGCLGAVLIAGAAFASAWLHRRHGANAQVALLLYFWGLAWWAGAGLREIDRFVTPREHPAALLALATLSAGLAAGAFRALRYEALAWTAAAALAAGAVVALFFGTAYVQPFAGWSLAAFAAYAAIGFLALRELARATKPAVALAHVGWIWTWTLAVGVALHRVASDAALAGGWREAATFAPLLVAWALALLQPTRIGPPLAARLGEYRGVVTGLQALVAAVAFAGLLFHAGDTSPIAYVPLLNPIELAQIAALALLWRWLADADTPSDVRARRTPLVAVAGFAFVTAATLRGVHHLGGVPWDGELGASSLAQMALTVVWSVLGVVAWVAGSRRGNRVLWLAGAVLMTIVLAKLLLIDRRHLGGMYGIGSFIAYGLLCTLVGYLAPAPPRSAATTGDAGATP